MQHDVDYLRPGFWNALFSDLRAIRNSDWNWDGIAMKLGLSARILLDFLTAGSPLMRPINKLFVFNKQQLADYAANEALIADLQTHVNQMSKPSW